MIDEYRLHLDAFNAWLNCPADEKINPEWCAERDRMMVRLGRMFESASPQSRQEMTRMQQELYQARIN